MSEWHEGHNICNDETTVCGKYLEHLRNQLLAAKEVMGEARDIVSQAPNCICDYEDSEHIQICIKWYMKKQDIIAKLEAEHEK